MSADEQRLMDAQFQSQFDQHHAAARDALRGEREAFVLYVPNRVGDDRCGVRFIGAAKLPAAEMIDFYNTVIEALGLQRQLILDAAARAEAMEDGDGEAEG